MKQFQVTPEHLKLIKRMYVSWEDCEYGAPAIDCKRPYGNSSVEQDMREILGYSENDDSTDFYALHKQTQTALQIAVTTGRFETGLYAADDYSSNWHKVTDERSA